MTEYIEDICEAGHCQPPGHMLHVPGICTTKHNSTEHIGRGMDASPPSPPTPQRNRAEKSSFALNSRNSLALRQECNQERMRTTLCLSSSG